MSTSSDQVFLHKEGEISGPHSPGQIRQLIETGELAHDHLYWMQGLVGWLPVSLFQKPAPSAVPPLARRIAVAAPPMAATVRPPVQIKPAPRRQAWGFGGSVAAHAVFVIVMIWYLGHTVRFHLPIPKLPMVTLTPMEPPPPPPADPDQAVDSPPAPSMPLPVPPPPVSVEEAAPVLPPVVPIPPLPVTIAPLSLPATPAAPPSQPHTATTSRRASHTSRLAASSQVTSEESTTVDPTNYLSTPKPQYPYAARQAHEEGTVELLVTLDSGGHPISAEINRSSGWPVLDQSARSKVLSSWLFKPGSAHRVLVPIMFEEQ